jgi:hypothetical protein
MDPKNPIAPGGASDTPPQSSSIKDVAASLIVSADAPTTSPAPNTDNRRPAAAPSPAAAEADDDEVAEPKAKKQKSPDPDTPDADEPAGREDGGADDEPDDDFFDPFGTSETTADDDDDEDDQDGDASDDQTFRVKINGKYEEVTLADMKKRYAGAVAIERRLQEATQARDEARTARTAVEAEIATERTKLSTDRDALAHAMTVLRSLIAAPTVKKPDPALSRSEPAKYTAQMAAWQADQDRVNTRSNAIDAALQQYQTTLTEERQTAKQAAAVKLAEAIPALKDPVKAPKVLSMIDRAAKSLNFTKEEIAAVTDHRLFVLAVKAGLYDQMKERAAAPRGKTEVKGQTALKPSGGQQPNPHRQAAAEHARKVKLARETGKPSDVAQTLIVPRRKRG